MDPTFLNDKRGKKSASRIGMLWGLFVGGLVVGFQAWHGTLDSTIFLVFMCASGGVYGMDKFSNEKTSN